MLRTPIRLVVLAVASAALLAGCGASGGSDAKADVTTTAPASDGTTTVPDDTSDTTEVPDTTDTTPDTPDTTVAEEPAGDDICVPLKVLSDFDIDSAELINGGDWPATQQFFVENTDDVLAAYDEAIAIDSEVTEDLKALKAVTETTAETARDSSDLTDFSGKLLAQPGIMEAGESGFALNTFAEENCGFSTGGNGQ